LNGVASGQPKSGDGAVESIRALLVARRGAVKARTQASNQLRGLIVTAPRVLREKLAGLPAPPRVKVAARFRPGDLTRPAEAAKAAMATVARRHQALAAEIAQLDTALETLVAHAAPTGFRNRTGVGTRVDATLLVTAGDNPGRLRTEASFAALCGASPVDASSGKQRRHRLNRGGTGRPTLPCGGLPSPGWPPTRAPRLTWPGAPARAKPPERSSAASSATSPAKFTKR
jgi:transposase